MAKDYSLPNHNRVMIIGINSVSLEMIFQGANIAHGHTVVHGRGVIDGVEW